MTEFVNFWIFLWVLVSSMGLAWEESCGNSVVFCYRIGEEILMRRASSSGAARHAETECSIPSGTSYTPSTMSRG